MRKCLPAIEQMNKVNTQILIISVINLTCLLSVWVFCVLCFPSSAGPFATFPFSFELQTNVLVINNNSLLKYFEIKLINYKQMFWKKEFKTSESLAENQLNNKQMFWTKNALSCSLSALNFKKMFCKWKNSGRNIYLYLTCDTELIADWNQDLTRPHTLLISGFQNVP